MTYPRAFMMPMGRRKYQGRTTVVFSRNRVVSVGRKGKVMYEEIRLQPYLKINSKVQTNVTTMHQQQVQGTVPESTITTELHRSVDR
jgi:hypothetical protein